MENVSQISYPEHLLDLVNTMISWYPERVILAHGRWYEENGTAELRRAFRYLILSGSGGS